MCEHFCSIARRIYPTYRLDTLTFRMVLYKRTLLNLSVQTGIVA